VIQTGCPKLPPEHRFRFLHLYVEQRTAKSTSARTFFGSIVSMARNFDPARFPVAFLPNCVSQGFALKRASLC
jgi:hypothetical protein